MSDGTGAAPAAPSTPSNGASPSAGQQPAPVPPSKPNAGPSVTTKPRMSDGKFAPKDGAAGLPKPEGTGTETPEAPAPKRFRIPVKVRGQQEEVWEGGEEDIQRELQQGRAQARKAQELQKRIAELEEAEKLAASNPDEWLRKRGVDPDEYARKRISELINLEAMSEEQRAALQVQQERDELAKYKQAQEAKAKAVKEQLLTKQLRTQRVEKYSAALKATGVELGTEAEKAEMVWRMASTESRLADESGHHDFTPEELAQETVRSAKADGKFYLSSLSTPALIQELGAERVQALLAHTIAEFEKASGSAVPTHQVQAPPARNAEAPASPYIDERELEERMKAARRGR